MVEEDVVVTGLAAAGVIAALLQPLKGRLPAWLLPYVAVAAGVLWNVGFTVGTDEFSRSVIFLGILTGLSAAGVYSAVRPLGTRVDSFVDRIRNGGGG